MHYLRIKNSAGCKEGLDTVEKQIQYLIMELTFEKDMFYYDEYCKNMTKNMTEFHDADFSTDSSMKQSNIEGKP